MESLRLLYLFVLSVGFFPKPVPALASSPDVNGALSLGRHYGRMAGLGLPKLRWLVIGAVVAGIWALRQEPIDPGKRHAVSRPLELLSEKLTDFSDKIMQKDKVSWRDAGSGKRHSAQVSAGRRQPAELAPRNSPRPDAQRATESAASRPSKAIARSMAPSDKPAAEQFYTTSRVRLRTEAGVGASTVAMLEQGQAVTILGASGKWRWVSTAGRKGWVHGDYIGLPAFHGPRPKEMIVGARADAAPKDAFSAWSGRSRTAATRKRPARPPQRGDCQCPYDFMIDGNQCGDRSAYVMRAGKGQCYL